MLNNTYLYCMLASVLATCILHFALASSLQKRGLLVALTTLIGTVLCVVLAKVGYCLLQWDYASSYGLVDVLLSDDMSMMSYYSGMLGVILGAIIAAKCTGNAVMPALNAYAPAGALLASLARFSEHYLDMICAGNYVENEDLWFFPYAVSNEWDEWYVAVHIFAGLFYLIIALVSLVGFKRQRFMRTLFYLCLVQVFCESLRNQSLFLSQFVRVEQWLCMIVVLVILVMQGARLKGEKKRFVPALTGVVCTGLFVAVEFGVGGKIFTSLSLTHFYGAMILGLVVLAVMEIWLARKMATR